MKATWLRRIIFVNNNTMVYAVWVCVAILALAIALFPWRRGNLARLRIAVCVEKNFAFNKLQREIKIFNKLGVVVAQTRGLPNLYLGYLGRLHVNCKFYPNRLDAFERLFYAAACANLFGRSSCRLVQRQLLKNLMTVFVTTKIIKRRVLVTKVIRGNFYVKQQKMFKVMRGAGYSKVVMRNKEPEFSLRIGANDIKLNCVFGNSYVMWLGGGLCVKNYVDAQLMCECFEIKNPGMVKFTLKTNSDKFRVNISQTQDSIFWSTKEICSAMFVMASAKEFGTNLTTKKGELDVHVTTSNAKIFVVRGKNKADVQKTISTIRGKGGMLNYLVDVENIKKTNSTEDILGRMFLSRYIVGEKLRKGYLAASKLVPTLHMPTLAHMVECPEDFFTIIDELENYMTMAQLGLRFNVVLLYSSANTVIKEMIAAFINRVQIRELIECGIFMFFLDRMKISQESIKYLLASHDNVDLKPTMSCQYCFCTNQHVKLTRVAKGNSQLVFANNPLNKSVAATVFVTINVGRTVGRSLFSLPAVVIKSGSKLTITSQKSGYSYSLKLPTGTRVACVTGRQVDEVEVQTDQVTLAMDVRIKPYGEKVFEIHRVACYNSTDAKTKEEKQNVKTVEGNKNGKKSA